MSSRSLRVRVGAVTAALCTALTVVALTPVASEAAARAANGARCTIVGTAGRDVLNGTARNDVICGGGGNDVINGRGGNDVIDGGAGNDSLAGSIGNDVLYGGAGRDALDGGAGGDRVDGGVDNDTLRGSDGNDVLGGGAGNDTVLGGVGNDRISGGDGRDVVQGDAGNDALSGAAGNDNLQGGPGADRISGGDGADLETGDDGNDVVTGNLGDDDLSGGSGADAVDGGAGFNVCDVVRAPGDRQVRCAVDSSKPVIGEVTAVQPSVDVSSADHDVKVLAHITDDTGVKRVEYGYGGFLVSGTRRNGTWAAWVHVPRGAVPGPRTVDIQVYDRVGRVTQEDRPAGFTVVNSVVDQQMPVVTSVSLSGTSFDVRTAAKTITTTARITDDLVGASRVYVCLAHDFPSEQQPTFRQAGGCQDMTMVSGTAVSSTWKGSLTIPKGAVSGTWNVQLWVHDAAANGQSPEFWFGPEAFASANSSFTRTDVRAIPNGAGAFTVLGSAPDTNLPTLTSLRLTPSRVDTATGAVSVTADIAATDPEGITDVDLDISGYPDAEAGRSWPDAIRLVHAATSLQQVTRISGTPQNGVWRATFVIPGGTPDGTYPIGISLQDSAHLESWDSQPGTSLSPSRHVLTDALAPTGTHFVVANSH